MWLLVGILFSFWLIVVSVVFELMLMSRFFLCVEWWAYFLVLVGLMRIVLLMYLVWRLVGMKFVLMFWIGCGLGWLFEIIGESVGLMV